MENMDVHQKLDKIINLLETVVSMNSDLIKANVKLTNSNERIVEEYGKPESGYKNIMEYASKQSKTSSDDEAEVFYKIISGKIYLSGKTFDLKDKIKKLGGKWTPKNKSWCLSCSVDEIRSVIPNIKMQENDGSMDNISNEQINNDKCNDTRDEVEHNTLLITKCVIDDD